MDDIRHEVNESVDKKMAEQDAAAIAALKPRKCPACGKQGIPRKMRGKYGRWFMGCPDFPSCPGKAVSLSVAQRKLSGQKLRWCYDFINRMGGVDEAQKWLKIASEVVITLKGGEV